MTASVISKSRIADLRSLCTGDEAERDERICEVSQLKWVFLLERSCRFFFPDSTQDGLSRTVHQKF